MDEHLQGEYQQHVEATGEQISREDWLARRLQQVRRAEQYHREMHATFERQYQGALTLLTCVRRYAKAGHVDYALKLLDDGEVKRG